MRVAGHRRVPLVTDNFSKLTYSFGAYQRTVKRVSR